MPKRVVYRFSANPQNDQVKLDMDDEVREPSRGDVLEIDGKRWKVNAVITERSLRAKGPIPVMTSLFNYNNSGPGVN
jgi:hypothetical protein